MTGNGKVARFTSRDVLVRAGVVVMCAERDSPEGTSAMSFLRHRVMDGRIDFAHVVGAFVAYVDYLMREHRAYLWPSSELPVDMTSVLHEIGAAWLESMRPDLPPDDRELLDEALRATEQQK